MNSGQITLSYEKRDYYICRADDMSDFISYHFCRNYNVVEDGGIDEDKCCMWIFPNREDKATEKVIQERVKKFMNGESSYALLYLLQYLCLRKVIPEGIYVIRL